MFEKTLADKFKKIFSIPKVSYDQPGESQEVECLFIEIERAPITFSDNQKKVKARVEGNALIWANADKIPFGFFQKAIELSDNNDTKDLFFYEIETNTKMYGNKVQRGFSFVYFFDSDFNPDRGTLKQIDFQLTDEG